MIQINHLIITKAKIIMKYQPEKEMEDDPTGLDIAALNLKSFWDKSVLNAPGINAGPANKRTYDLSKGTVRDYFDYLKKHGITYSLNFLKKKKKKRKYVFTYPKDRIDPNNLKILG